MPRPTIKEWFNEDDAERQSVLQRQRLCASLTIPAVLPPLGQTGSQKLPETYQSIGSRGVSNVVGKSLMALFHDPWFVQTLSPEVQYDLRVPDEAKQMAATALFMHDMVILSTLQSAGLTDRQPFRRTSFHSKKHEALTRLFVTGDVLERLGDDFRLRCYRNDAYTTKRDDDGWVRWHTIKERVDPIDDLTEEEFSMSGLDRSALEMKRRNERCMDMFTAVQWQPRSRNWLIEQEVHDKIIKTSEEPVSPYLSSTYMLLSGENYGRGLTEINLGDLRSENELEKHMLRFAAMAAKYLIMKDYGCQTRDKDFEKDSGSVVQARVSGGVVQDSAVFKPDKYADFQVVNTTIERKMRDLGKAFLIESDTTPTGERVTAFQVSRVVQELQGALGGVYAFIADDQQIPLLQRTIYQLQRMNKLPVLPKGAVDLRVTTGIAALNMEVERQKLVEFAQAISLFGPSAAQYVDIGVLVDAYMRRSRLYEPGLRKSREQIEQEIQQSLAVQADQKMIETAGNVVENRMTAKAA